MPWGKETQFNSPFGVFGKIINLKADFRTSLKYYTSANQCLFLEKGKVSVYAPEESEFGDIKSKNGNFFELVPGDTILIQKKNPYRIKALEDSVLIEVLQGTSFKNNMVRLDDDYGRTE
tara:strand:+ start:14345 stop:14701 length:357 start_codon:yes stop_codon:yes gene_type:complete